MFLVRANRFIGCFPGLKPWAKFFRPFGASPFGPYYGTPNIFRGY
jgi:hypothetical protein